MLAKLVDAAIDPARLDVAVAALEAELIPGFLAQEGAVRGYWCADTGTGHVLTVTLWRDADSLLAAAAADGVARATVGDRVGLRLRSVQTLPVLAHSHGTDASADPSDPGSIRVTWVDGVAPAMRDLVPRNYRSTLADQHATAGFRGSYWLGDERSVEGCALSLWDGSAHLDAGVDASHRRRRRLARTMGIHVSSVREYQVFGVADTARAPSLSA